MTLQSAWVSVRHWGVKATERNGLPKMSLTRTTSDLLSLSSIATKPGLCSPPASPKSTESLALQIVTPTALPTHPPTFGAVAKQTVV